MKENKKRTLYFLDWLKEEYDIDPEVWLNNMRPENQRWEGDASYIFNNARDIEFFFKEHPTEFIGYSFLWREANEKIIETLRKNNCSLSLLDDKWKVLVGKIFKKNHVEYDNIKLSRTWITPDFKEAKEKKPKIDFSSREVKYV